MSSIVVFTDSQKFCPKCLLYKNFSEFHSDRSKKLHISTLCKLCSVFYSKEKHIRNRDKHLQEMRDRYYKHKEFLKNYLLEHPCVDCGNTDVRVLDFDHVKGTKTHNVSALISSSLVQIIKEIAKCEVRCANCHRIRHYREK